MRNLLDKIDQRHTRSRYGKRVVLSDVTRRILISLPQAGKGNSE
jgi:hypothetical protein